jgi:hypothetical protein
MKNRTNRDFLVVGVEARLVDGGSLSLDTSSGLAILQALSSGRLAGDYFTGRQIIDSLVTDDWGPPPTGLRISVVKFGRTIELYIPYDDTPSEDIEADLTTALG